MASNYRALLERANFENETRQKIIENQEEIIKNLEGMEQINRKMNDNLHKQVQTLRDHIETYKELLHNQNELVDAYYELIGRLSDQNSVIESEMPVLIELLKLHKEFKEKEVAEIKRMTSEYEQQIIQLQQGGREM